MRRLARIVLLLALIAPSLAPGLALAVTPGEMLKDPAAEARARAARAAAWALSAWAWATSASRRATTP